MALRSGPATFSLLLAFLALPGVASARAGDDAAALRDAAESRIFQVTADRESLEEGLSLALRGAELARSGPKRDRALAARLLVHAGEQGLTSDGSFPLFYIAIQASGGRLVTVPLKDYTFDLEAIAQAINPRTRIIILANPNNPTGAVMAIFSGAAS